MSEMSARQYRDLVASLVREGMTYDGAIAHANRVHDASEEDRRRAPDEECMGTPPPLHHLQRRGGCAGHPCEDDPERFPHAGIGDTFLCDGSCGA
jgi:hypothetical protein